jgi:hypothetical protein
VLARQASHNTWTKRLSLVFYWGNAFGIGVPCSIASLVLSPFGVGGSIANNGGDAVLPIATVVYTLSLSITVLGMSKLVGLNTKDQCKNDRKGLRHTQLKTVA